MVNYIGKKVHRHGSNVIWEVCEQDIDGIAIIQYSSSKASNRRISWEIFNKNWTVKGATKFNENDKPKTLKQLNQYIQTEYPLVEIIKEKDYFYIASDNDEMGLKISSLQLSSIYATKVSQMSFKLWMENVKELFNDATLPYYSGEE